MKISRYIYIPLIIGVLYSFIGVFSFDGFFPIGLYFIAGTLLGFGFLFYNDHKIKKIASKDNQEAFKVRPQKNVIIFTHYDKAFDLCLDSLSVLGKGKIKKEDKTNGSIKFRTSMSWESFGHNITYEIKELTQVTTEVEIKSVPIPRTALLDYGEGFKHIEDIAKYLDEKNQEMELKYLNEKCAISVETYTNFLNKKEKCQ